MSSGAIPRAMMAFALLGVSACAATEGDGNITTEVRTVEGAYSGIIVRSGLLLELTLTPGATQAIDVTIDENLQKDVDLTIFENALIIDADDIAPTAVPTIRLTTEGIVTMTANGPATTIIATGVAVTTAGDVVAIGASEGGTIEVSGACTDLVAIATGDSTVRAGALACERGELEVLGESLLEVSLTESAILRGAGKSTVRISGMPSTVEQNVTDEVTVTVE